METRAAGVVAAVRRALDFLRRYDAWIGAIVSIVLAVWGDAVGPPSGWFTWSLFAVALTLFWIPALLRVPRLLRRTAEAYREGLHGR